MFTLNIFTYFLTDIFLKNTEMKVVLVIDCFYFIKLNHDEKDSLITVENVWSKQETEDDIIHTGFL